MVGLLALAHERGCEAELAGRDRGRPRCRAACPTSPSLRARFAPTQRRCPTSPSRCPPLAAYDGLLATVEARDDAA